MNFGTLASAVTITHLRFRRGSDDGQPVVVALSPSFTVSAGSTLRIPAGSFDVVYPSGTLTNPHMQALVEGYWGASGSRTRMEVDALVQVSPLVRNVVSVGGYNQVSTNSFSVTAEND